MRLPHCVLLAAIALCLLGLPSKAASAQAQAGPEPAPAASAPKAAAMPPVSPGSAASPDPANVPGAAPAKKTYTVPAGTKVLLQLRSGINTKSAKPGDGVYLASIFPVVVGSRVMIPAGVYVQGVVDRVVRAGRVKGKSQLDMHFTSMIFPNGTVVEIPGVVNSLPGAKNQTSKGRWRRNHRAGCGQGTECRQSRGDRNSNRRNSRFDWRPGRRASDCRRSSRHRSWACRCWPGVAIYPRRGCQHRERNPGGDEPAAAAHFGGGKPKRGGPARQRSSHGPCGEPTETA